MLYPLSYEGFSCAFTSLLGLSRQLGPDPITS
jgi:hypothetical protein